MSVKKLPDLHLRSNGGLTDIDGRRRKFFICDYVTLRQSTYPDKFFVLQDIVFENGQNEIRIGYYIIGKKPAMRGRWVWGQYCPFIPKRDFKRLLGKAHKKGIL